ncbi:hypothetical protein [Metabacillus fastidiosus]|uniref:hypothetical protein n=1 Tax=Metabacillus fastidiosus TaxID=1458 RepID=UPI003D2AB800
MTKEKAFLVKNSIGQWISIVSSLTKPSEKYFGAIWIEKDPDECENQLKEMSLEFTEAPNRI